MGRLVTCEGGTSALIVAAELGVSLEASEASATPRSAYTCGAVAGLAPALDGSSSNDVIAYANDPALEARLRRQGCHLRGPSPRLKARLDRKDWTRTLFARAGIRSVESLVAASDVPFDVVADRLGAPFVIQSVSGSSGRSTWLVGNPRELATVRATTDVDAPRLASRWEPGPTLNVHGLVASDGIEVSAASVQLTGPTELSDERFAYCGGDFIAAERMPSALLLEAAMLTRRVGEILRALGWLGIYGLDIQVSDGQLLVLEINPRLQASSWLLAEIEQRQGIVPMGARHERLLLGDQDAATVATGERGDTGSGAFLVIRQGRPGGHVPCVPRVGYYRRVDETLHFARSGVGFLGCRVGEIYLEGFGPAPGAWHQPGATLARVACAEQLVELDGRTLTEHGRHLATSVLGMLRSSRAGVVCSTA